VAALALLAAGCGGSPKAVFTQLQDAALKKDARAIWQNLSSETRADLAERARAAFKEPGPEGAPKGVLTEAEGREYLAMLAGNLDDLSIEYIRSLRPGDVKIEGATATINLVAFRFEPPEKPLTFRKVDGKWVWDARDILAWYLENRTNITSLSEGGF
jgi:hypothetical protein